MNQIEGMEYGGGLTCECVTSHLEIFLTLTHKT